MQATLIYNSNAGGVKKISVDALQDALRAVGFAPVYRATSSEKDLGAALKDAAGLVVASGGDGTVRAVATRLVGKGLPLCILPLGTANNIGRTLGVGGDPLELIEGLRAPRKRFLDVGFVRAPWGEDYFLEAMGFGLYADVLADYHPEEGKSFVRSLNATLDTLQRYVSKSCPLAVDGRTFEGPYLLVEALNTAATGPRLKLAPDADPGDGLLDVIMIHEDERVRLAGYLSRLLNETLDELPNVEVARGRRLEFEWPGFPVHIDGEVRPLHHEREEREPAPGARPPGGKPTDKKVYVELLPGALEVWLPRLEDE